MPQSVAEGCGLSDSSFGPCTRQDPVRGQHDYYETHDPNLEKAGLPWFYFISSPLKIVKAFRKKYISESEALWGKEHWEEPHS